MKEIYLVQVVPNPSRPLETFIVGAFTDRAAAIRECVDRRYWFNVSPVDVPGPIDHSTILTVDVEGGRPHHDIEPDPGLQETQLGQIEDYRNLPRCPCCGGATKRETIGV